MHNSSLLEETLVELGIAQTALDDARDFFRTRAIAPHAAGIERASDDPHVILRFGQLQARLHAAQGLLARATRIATADSPSAAQVAATEARAFATDLIAEIIGQVTAWGSGWSGAMATLNMATLNASHWNYYSAGNYYLKGIEPAPATRDAFGTRQPEA